MLFLGMDGGGTKTAFALLNQAGEIIAEHEEATCYHIDVGIDGAREILQKGVTATLKIAGKNLDDISYSFFGLPTYGEDSSLTETLDLLPNNILPLDKYDCDNDMVTAWAAGFGGEDGINVVSGTGSIAYGVRKKKKARCGGWGELFSDEGSAYWIGCRALTAFSKMSDGREAKTPLYDIVKSELAVKNDWDISALIHTEWKGRRGKVAQLSKLVSEAAAADDINALAIFCQAGEQLADIVEGTKQSLHFENNETIKLSYSGGVFSSGKLLLAPFEKALAKYSPHYSLEKPLHSPVIGAALYAQKIFNRNL